MSDAPRRDTGVLRALGAPPEPGARAESELRLVALEVLAEYGHREDLSPEFASSVSRAIASRARSLIAKHGLAMIAWCRGYDATLADYEAPTRRVTAELAAQDPKKDPP